MDDYPQVTLGVSEDTIGDLALFKPHLPHITLDYGEPCEWGITGPVECPDEFTHILPPLGLCSGELDVDTAGALPVQKRTFDIDHHQLTPPISVSTGDTIREEIAGCRQGGRASVEIVSLITSRALLSH